MLIWKFEDWSMIGVGPTKGDLLCKNFGLGCRALVVKACAGTKGCDSGCA